RQAGANYALIAFYDVYRVGNPHVADDQETMRELASGGFEQREILLIQAHGQNQAFRGDFQTGWVELAHIDGRMLNERCHFVQQGVDLRVVADGGAQVGGMTLQLLQDIRTAGLEARYDLALFEQLRFVGVGCRDIDDAFRHEAMTFGTASGRETERLHGHDVLTPQCDQTARRSYEADAGHAVGQLVAHYLGDRELGNGLVQRFLQAGLQRFAVGHALGV